MSNREEIKIELFKNMFLDVLIVDCTKVVETFDIIECFASLRPELIRNPDYCQVNIIILRGFVYKIEASTDCIVPDIS